MKLGAKELRDIEDKELEEKLKDRKINDIYLIVENVYDTYNVGGLFRLADALGVTRLYLCGQTDVPPNHKIKKASIGTFKVVPWIYKSTAKEAIEEIRANNPTLSSPPLEGIKGRVQKSSCTVVAVEQDKRAVDYRTVDYSFPVALIVGNETFGVLPETLDLADKIVEIPMWGINKSLNVIVSAAIVSYHVMDKR